MRLHFHHKPVSHEVAVERAHSADLARRLAEAHETIGKQARAIDALKGERRMLSGQVANLRAQLAATVEAKR